MLFPYAESKRIVLRPATVQDGRTVYDVLLRLGETALPTVDDFVERSMAGVAARFLVQPRGLDTAVGFTELVKLSQAGHVEAGVHIEPGQDPAVQADTAALIVNFAFSMWRVRKVYFRTARTSLDHLGFDGANAGLAHREAIIGEHLFFQGRLWDEYIFSVSRDDWNDRGIDMLNDIV